MRETAGKIWQENEEFEGGFPFRGWESSIEKFTYPAHWHDYYEIIQVLQGEADIVVNGISYHGGSGDIIFVDPARIHGFPARVNQRNPHLRFFHFLPKIFAGEELNSCLDVFSNTPILHAPSASEDASQAKAAASSAAEAAFYQTASSLLDAVFDEYRRKKSLWRFAIRTHICGLALAALRQSTGQISKLPPPHTHYDISDTRFERVSLFVNQRFSDYTLSLDDAAREAALSRFHFTRFFKRKTGLTFHAYLQAIRLSHAKEMLLKTGLPITLVSEKSGFSSLSTFFHAFKNDTGLTPVKYRNAMRRGSE